MKFGYVLAQISWGIPFGRAFITFGNVFMWLVE